MVTLNLLASLALLALNAFFVLAEYSLLKVRSTRVEELAQKGSASAALLKSINANLDRYISAIQLGITMASLGLGWLAEPAVAALFQPQFARIPERFLPVASHSLALGLAFLIITFIHVVVGELAPKYVAIRAPTRAAIWIAAPLQVYYGLVYPLMAVLNATAGGLLKLLGLKSPDQAELAHSDEELRMLLTASQERGALPLSRLLLFENLFDFGNTTVREIMTPLSSISALSTEWPWKDNWGVIQASKHTRYPLIGKDMSDIRGVVHFKDLLLLGSTDAPDLGAVRREPLYLQEGSSLEKALAELRTRRSHLAMVKDKAGQVTGLVTLEDVLEELVGEIHDEFETPNYVSLSETVVADAIEMNLPTAPKPDVIRAMLQKLGSARPDINLKEAWEVVWRREAALSSAVGKEIALPHGRLPGLAKPVLVLGRCPAGADFDSLDQRPVRLIFLILTPLKDPGAQLRLLAKVATMASNPTFRRNLLGAKSAREAMDILMAFDQSVAE